ncbi:MAG: SusC/RagA family TonB-linked outer membrane protein [Gemmatimonadetes bacterium]|nr:SusC/RagA family TonB-linked outer membrane protein [Gemmatimonadota bacterium]
MNIRRVLFCLASIGWAVAAPGELGAQGTQGTITGRVTEVGTNQPVPSAQVTVLGSPAAALTNADGQFTIRGVLAGTVTVRTLRIGYAESRQQAEVRAGQSVTVNFVINPVPASLSAVVTTATGDQRRVEVGNAIAQVSAADLTKTLAITSVGDLLGNRAAGVAVFGATQPGAGIRIRIRGTSSMSLSNNPIYFIDGIRVEGTTGSSTVSVGGTLPSRVGDLNPEEIENIEIVRGPSAATLYGTDAANGVIVITTKKGVAGKPQWTYYTEQTAVQDYNDYPTAYTGWRTGTTSTTNTTKSNANAVFCMLSAVSAGTCVQDSLTAFDMTSDKDATPFGTGYRYQHGLQVRGGSDLIRYFLHAEVENEDGVTKVPEFEKRYMAARALGLSARQTNPGGVSKITTRANLNIALSPQADLAVNAGYISQEIKLPRSDDSGTPGIAANIFGGPGMKYNTNAAGDTLYGWREFTPRVIYQAETTQQIERFITSMSANYRPFAWVALRANAGVDFIGRTDKQLCRFSNCPSITDKLGFKIDNRTNFFTYTVDGSATATRTLSPTVESKTTAGVQFYRNTFDRNGVTGLNLPPGAVQITAASTIQGDESTSESRTLGAYIEEGIAWRDKLFVTGAIRSDRNSAFGANFKTVFYPKLSVSWVVSDESFFPKYGWVNQIRLRTASGAAGVQPGTTDAVPYYSASTYRGESGDLPAVVYTTLGNRNLKPERSTEIEFGIDGTFWDNRIVSEFTYYSKLSSDALVSRILPPSLGTGATARLENVGKVKNAGLEAYVRIDAIKRDAFGWDVTLNGSSNQNKLVSLNGLPNIVISSTLQHREGYPLNGWWSRRLTSFQDKNGNGIITYNADPAISEISVTDTAVFLGNPLPKYELVMTNGVEFWKRRIRVSAQLDYKGGFKIYNNTERIRCASRNNCRALFDKTAPLDEQARVIMVREHPSRSVAGFIEDGDFIRFRELSVNANLPNDWARTLRARSVTATAAVRNLGVVWTKYGGLDPEAFGTTGDAPSSFQAFGPPTYFTFRFTLGF